MPQRPPRLIDGGETNLRQRIARERQDRGWSLAALSDRLGEIGFRIDRTSLHKIEKGTRSITWDEAVALAQVFGVTTDDLRVPVAVLDSRAAERLLIELDAVTDDLRAVVGRLERVVVEYDRVAKEQPGVHEHVAGGGHGEARMTTEHGRYFAPVLDIGDDDKQVQDAVESLVDAVVAKTNRQEG